MELFLGTKNESTAVHPNPSFIHSEIQANPLSEMTIHHQFHHGPAIYLTGLTKTTLNNANMAYGPKNNSNERFNQNLHHSVIMQVNSAQWYRQQ
jgi:hypothetical protein